MLRAVRIMGLVVFAFLVGLSGNSLWKMHETGELMEQYNSRRRADLTLLVFSIGAVGALGYFELLRLLSQREKRGYGGMRYPEQAEKRVEGVDTSNIYSAPKTIDAWQGHRIRTSKSRHKQRFDASGIWLVLLRIICLALLTAYLALLVLQVLKGTSGSLLVTLYFALLSTLSLVVALGVFSRRMWGLAAGYVLCIGNLVVFPLGTVAGLLLLMGLVGATPCFMPTDQKRRKPGKYASAA